MMIFDTSILHSVVMRAMAVMTLQSDENNHFFLSVSKQYFSNAPSNLRQLIHVLCAFTSTIAAFASYTLIIVLTSSKSFVILNQP
jgi:hypothetical protein